MSQRKIIHCDADCFFAALEMRDDPSLLGVPMAVGGDPYKRGVIATCNYEARAFGIHSAQASAYAKRLCPNLVIVPGNMKKYTTAGQQLKEIFLGYTDKVESLSLDEAFLDVSTSQLFSGSATLIAQDIRKHVYDQIGITVSAGVAPNKFIAKIASDWQKPNGLTVIEPGKVASFLYGLPVKLIPGVGPHTTTKLADLGIKTCGDILLFSHIELVQRLGILGQRLYHFSRGNDDRPVQVLRERKSLSVENTFDTDIPAHSCYPLLLGLYEKLQSRLTILGNDASVSKIFVKIKFADFSLTSVECNATHATVQTYSALFDEGSLRNNQSVRLIGVGVRFKALPSANGGMYQQKDLFVHCA